MSVRQIRVDDLDGTSTAAKTVQFGVDGQQFEIDLSDEHLEEFQSVIGKYAQVARRSEFDQKFKRQGGSNRSPRARREPRVSHYETKPSEPPKQPEHKELGDIRSWAKSRGFRVGDRGRVSGLIREAYQAALRENGDDAA